MSKSKQLNQWLWKWHIIAGLVSVPIMALLCITGSIYLFKSHFNDYAYQDARFTSVDEGAVRYPYSEQLVLAQEAADGHIMSVILPTSDQQTTAFRQHSKGHARNLVYVDPYTNKVTGTYEQRESLMYTVRKLHGELLLGLPGTLMVELVASWFVVLAITGVYVWWPFKGFSLAGFFTVRSKKNRRLFWRDMHAVIGFWMSLFMLIILAGGMPWTELFGDQLKWVQKQTSTGYPQHWRNSKGLSSDSELALAQNLPTLSLDKVVNIAAEHNLAGQISVKIPMDEAGVYTISNRALWLQDQHVIHLDQYSGKVIKQLNWSQIGVLMEMRQFFMRLHQGEYGLVNLIAVLIVVLAFLVSTIASLVSYVIRKPKGRWGLPKVPDNFNAGTMIVVFIVLLGILFPAFGISLLLIVVIGQLFKVLGQNRSAS